MSVSAFICVSLPQTKNINIPGSQIIPQLVNAGWRIFTTDGMVGHLPAEISNDFEWQYGPLNFVSLIDIFKEKEKRKEPTGVRLFWQNSFIEGRFSFFYDDVMCTSLVGIDADRQLVALAPGYMVTDFQWYLEKILPPLNDAFGVEYFQCHEHI
jgi:hypothetical protein